MQPGQEDNKSGSSQIPVTGMGSVALDGYDLAETRNTPAVKPNKTGEVHWEASEYIHHEKHAGWFLLLALAVLILGGISVYLRQWTFTALVLVMAITIVVYARRTPRSISYSVTNSGVTIEDKSYSYSEFKSFGISQEGGVYSLVLTPIKRFMPSLTMYFEEKDGEALFDILATHLPHKEVKQDIVDKLTKKLRF